MRSPKPEYEQLEAAILQWVEPQELFGLIKANSQHWRSKNALDIEETALSPEGQDERRPLARRLYGIRCRIVHTKFAGGVPPILPLSKEVEWLHHDIQLAEFVAQKAITYHAREQ